MQNVRNVIGGMGNLMFKEAYLYAQVREGSIPDVYLQDEKYFSKYANEIRQMYGEGIGFLPYVGIHIRRGDYVGNKFHVSLSDETDYYERAIELFPNAKFLVFSDEPVWCAGKFAVRDDRERFQVLRDQTELEDFNMLASCENIIGANSSFSWWASYLNPSPVRRAIFPRLDKWFHDGIVRVGIPEDWEQIDYVKN